MLETPHALLCEVYCLVSKILLNNDRYAKYYLPSFGASLIILISVSQLQPLKLLLKTGVRTLNIQRGNFLSHGTMHESFQALQNSVAKFKEKKVTEYNSPVIPENPLRSFWLQTVQFFPKKVLTKGEYITSLFCFWCGSLQAFGRTCTVAFLISSLSSQEEGFDNEEQKSDKHPSLQFFKIVVYFKMAYFTKKSNTDLVWSNYQMVWNTMNTLLTQQKFPSELRGPHDLPHNSQHINQAST